MKGKSVSDALSNDCLLLQLLKQIVKQIDPQYHINSFVSKYAIIVHFCCVNERVPSAY